ncbi:FGGY-family carbohydrate kinase [Microbacterium abyssi]|uniref:FGGY-family carbohydrate kinase n=1 Tax=Microbacterium abyssi TaxID=2782166 RepID=UPI001889603D|nr:FGGY family carbohydrate kinase [Microbacterium sp. A18JL241]
MTLVLGLDIGSTSTKAALVDVADGVTIVRVARRPTPSTADDLVVTAAAVARDCVTDAAMPVAAVGIASMAESGAPLDAEGRALTPLLRWDRRVDRSHLDSLLTRLPDLPVATGVPATTKPAAVALTALRAEQPDAFAAMRHWSGAADLIARVLTGERATDHTLAARTMLAGARGDSWDADVLDGLGLRDALLPTVRAPGEPAGSTTASARAFGLAPGIPVHIAGHDHVVGTWGVGVRSPGETADSLGTAEAIVRVTHAVDIARAVAAGFSVGRTVDGSAATVLGGSPACGAMLAGWDAEHPDDHVISHLSTVMPDEWIAGSSIVLPYPSGRQCPRPDPGARVRVLGDARDASDRAHSLLQSLVAHSRWMRETADEFAGSPTSVLTVLGSLAERIPIWAPLVATAHVPTRISTVDEPVAAGAALLAAVRSGEVAAGAAILPRTAVAPLHAPESDDIHRRFLAAVTEGEQ